MKKLILKTAVITFGVTLILAVSVFGIVSYVSPSVMMRFCDSLGLESISGDYAYQQYQISGDIDYLARAFEIAAMREKDTVASERFDEFYGEEGSERRSAFVDYCALQDSEESAVFVPSSNFNSDYRSYVCAQATLVKFRLAVTQEQRQDVCVFAVRETGAEVALLSPLSALAEEKSVTDDSAFCFMLLGEIRAETKFNITNERYLYIVNLLEEASK